MCGTPARNSAVAGRQPKDSSMNKQGAYLSLPPLFFSSAWTCNASTDHICSLAHSLSPSIPLFSSHFRGGMAQVESMLSSCAADHGHHTMHACQWPTPTPHRLTMSVATLLLRVVVWKKGCPPTACVRVCACVPHPAASPTLHPVRVGAHICVLIFLEAHG